MNHPGILQLRKENKDHSKFVGAEGSGDENIACNMVSKGTFRLVTKQESSFIRLSSLLCQLTFISTAENLDNPHKKCSNDYDDEVSELPYPFHFQSYEL